MIRTLTLDCAQRTGWATNCAGRESGYQDFPLRRGSSPGMRFVEFRLWLERLCEQLRPEVLVFEQAHHRGGAATELCVGFVTRVMEVAAARGIEYRSIHSSTLKKFATGSGKAEKGAMQARAAEMVGRAVPDDNEADALLMLAWAEAGFPETETTRRKK